MERRDPPDPAAVDAAFARFARTGDPDALGAVFDTLAPRLILIAVHLVDGEADAEDVLQATFVEAIRGAERFTPGRPVMPWLVTILARRAANLRRSRRRASAAGTEAVIDPGTGPADDAAAKETAERIAAAVDALPPPAREALTLHLLHGMRPIEVARALDRPVGTVHAQLHRGLKQLRRALPPGVVPVTMAALLGTRGTAAVRARVLAEGRRVVIATATGTALYPWFAAAVAGLLALLGGAWAVAAAMQPVTMVEESAGPLATATRRGLDAARPDESLPPALPSREVLLRGPQVVLTGRAVDDDTGLPFHGATVTVEGYHSHGGTPPETWTPPQAVQTGADGRYRLVVPLREDVGISIRIAAADRVPVAGSWQSLRPGLVMDHGDVPLVRGTHLRVRIVDENERPVEGSGLQLNEVRMADRYRFGLSLLGLGTQVSDARGYLPPRIVAPGRITLTEDTDHAFECVGPWSFDVAPGRVEQEFVFRVRHVDPAMSVRGRVVDQMGTPVVDLLIGADVGRGWRMTRTRPGGAFAIGRMEPDRAPMRLGLMRAEGRFELIEPLTPVAVGEDVHVIVRRLHPVQTEFRVVGPDGAPVEEFAAICCAGTFDKRWQGTRLSGPEFREPMGRHPGGRFTAELRPLGYLLCLRPADDSLATVIAQPFEVSPDRRDCVVHVTLERPRPLRVRALTRFGAPVAGVRVTLSHTIGRGRMRSTGWSRGLDEFLSRGPRGTFAVVDSCAATTGADGRAVLRCGRDLGTAELLLEAPHIVPLHHPVGPETPADEVRIEVVPAGIVTGRLRPAGIGLAWGPTPELRERWAVEADGEATVLDRMPKVRLVDPEHPDVRTRFVPIGVDDRFELRSVPPGTWQLELSRRSCPDTRIGTPFLITGGERRDLELDVPELKPASLSASVFHNGEPVREERIRLYLSDGNSAMATLDQSGRFELHRLPAGALAPRLEIGASRDAATLTGAAAVRLRAGEHREVRLEFFSRTLRLRLIGPGGTPLAGRRVSLHEPGRRFGHISKRRVTDARGVATFTLVPPEPVEVRHWPEDAPATYIQLPDPETAPLVGRIPAGRRDVSTDVTVGR